MTGLILARHGQSFGNLDHSLGPDTDLTELGRTQAQRLGDWLSAQGYTFDALYASTLRRAQQTAQIINAHFNLEITPDPDLCEAEVWLPDTLPTQAGPLDANPAPPFDLEYTAMQQRVARATARILEENPSGRVLVVAHGGTLGTMIRGILGSHALLIHTDLTGLHGLSWQDGLWYMQFLNRRQHLQD